MMYYANFSRNSGEYLKNDLFGTNKSKLVSRIRTAAREGCYCGSEYKWFVFDAAGFIVAIGGGYKHYNGVITYYNYKDQIGTSVYG